MLTVLRYANQAKTIRQKKKICAISSVKARVSKSSNAFLFKSESLTQPRKSTPLVFLVTSTFLRKINLANLHRVVVEFSTSDGESS